MRFLILIISFSYGLQNLTAQVGENDIGAWYMYFYSYQFNDSQFGIQGDFQYRDWQILGDQEQLLLRSGFTYKPKESDVIFTLGFANISTGEFGDSDAISNENRVYQEALLNQKIINKVLITHRFRYEQRFVEGKDFRTRYRYNVFVNIPFNNTNLRPKTVYGAFYNELFINGEKDIGDNRNVELFDRNRTYLGLGYVLNKKIRFQMGWMKQITNIWNKGQLQFSMHHNF